MIENVLKSDLDFVINNMGYEIKINGEKSRALINNKALKSSNDDKTIISKDKLQEGDIITCKGVDYIIMSLIVDSRYNEYYKGILRPANYNLNISLFDEGFKVKKYEAYVEAMNFKVKENGIPFPVSLDEKFIHLKKDTFNSKINKKDKVIMNHKAYEVIGIDLNLGNLLMLQVKETQLTYDDNLELEVCNYWKYNKIAIEIINLEPVSVNVGEELELNIMTTPNNLEYKITATNDLISVIGNKIIGVKEGTGIISIKDVLYNGTRISFSKEIKVISPGDEKSITITSPKNEINTKSEMLLDIVTKPLNEAFAINFVGNNCGCRLYKITENQYKLVSKMQEGIVKIKVALKSNSAISSTVRLTIK